MHLSWRGEYPSKATFTQMSLWKLGNCSLPFPSHIPRHKNRATSWKQHSTNTGCLTGLHHPLNSFQCAFSVLKSYPSSIRQLRWVSRQKKPSNSLCSGGTGLVSQPFLSPSMAGPSPGDQHKPPVCTTYPKQRVLRGLRCGRAGVRFHLTNQPEHT